MRKNIARSITVAAALMLGTTASAHAAQFLCSAQIGPSAGPNGAGTMVGAVQANSKVDAEAKYHARVATVAAPVRSGRWVIHTVNCLPAK